MKKGDRFLAPGMLLSNRSVWKSRIVFPDSEEQDSVFVPKPLLNQCAFEATVAKFKAKIGGGVFC